MTSQIGFPLETVYSITSISQASPGVVTLSETSRDYAFSVADQQTVSIRNVLGMTELNYNRYIVNNLDTNTNTFTLLDLEGAAVDTSEFHPYISGGEIDIISYPGTPPGLMYNNQ